MQLTDSRFGDAENLGDLFHSKLLVVVKQYNLLLSWFELADRPGEFFDQLGLLRVFVRVCGVRGRQYFTERVSVFGGIVDG